MNKSDIESMIEKTKQNRGDFDSYIASTKSRREYESIPDTIQRRSENVNF